MEKIDVLVMRVPRFYTDMATIPIFPEEILLPTILEENGITSRFFNADFLPFKLRFNILLHLYPAISDYLNYEKKLREFLKGKSLKWKNVKRIVKKFNPKIVLLIMRMPSDFSATIKTAEIIKKINKEIKVGVYGGGNENFQKYLARRFLKNDSIDFLIIGEPEHTLLEVAKNICREDNNIFKIKGLALRKGKKIVFTKKRPFEKILDNFPIANRDLVLYRKFMPPSAFSVIEGGRGCIYSCNFCLAAGIPFRLRSPEKVVEEIAKVYCKYGTRIFSFPMSSFLHSRKWALRVCSLISKFKLNIKFACCANLNQLDKKILKVLKSAGCYTLGTGLESANNNTLLKMNKISNLKLNIKKVAKMLKDSGIFLRTGVIINNPGEKLSEMENTLSSIYYFLPNLCRVQFLIPWPGTKFFEEVKNRGLLIDENLDFYNTGRINIKPSINEKILKKIWIKYAKLYNHCEWICFRKKLFDKKLILFKISEYFNYLLTFFY